MAVNDPKLLKARSAVDIRPVPRRRRGAAPETHAGEPGTLSGFWITGGMALAVCTPNLLLGRWPIVGVCAEFVAVGALIAIGLFARRARKLAIAAAVLPTASIVTLSLGGTNFFADATIYYGAMLLLALVYRYMFLGDIPANHMTSSKSTRLNLVIVNILSVITGVILGALGYGLLRHEDLFHGVPLAIVVAVSVVFAISEEMYFQGLLQQLAFEVVGVRLATLLTIVAYSLASRANASSIFFSLVAGCVLAGFYMRRQNLIAVTIINALMKVTYIALISVSILHLRG